MYFFIKHKNRVLLIVSLLLMSHTTLFASTSYMEMKSVIEYPYIEEEKSVVKRSDVEVSLDSFGGTSMIIILVLTSLLGVFFVRDELAVL